MIMSSKQIKIVNIDKLSSYADTRECYSELVDFINSGKGSNGRLCALYGLRRTGKTVMLNQMAKELKSQGHKCLYLVCSDERKNIVIDRNNGIKHEPEIAELFSILEQALEEKYEYVFIDELTFIKDFVGQGNVLSNVFSMQGLTIVATGTDSLGFSLVEDDDMYDRLTKIHTSYVSFEEYNRLLGKTLDEYIAFGGTLKEESPYKNIKNTIAYTNNAIVQNIVKSIKASEHIVPDAITLLYSERDIVSTINRCIDNMNQQFLISAINRNDGVFESHPLHLALRNANNFPYAMYIDVVSIDDQVRESLFIKNRDNMSAQMEQTDVDRIKDALLNLDLVLSIPNYLSVKQEIKKSEDTQIISQAGMIYCHATELIEALTNSENWRKIENITVDKKEEFIRRIDRQVKGDILENIVLYDTYKALDKDYFVTKLRLNNGNEIDVVVTNRKTYDTYLFEIKYADYIDEKQTKHLVSKEFNKYIEENFGTIKGRYLIYTGNSKQIEHKGVFVDYLSAETFLKAIVHSSSVPELLAKCQVSQNSEVNKKISENPFLPSRKSIVSALNQCAKEADVHNKARNIIDKGTKARTDN